MVSYKGYKVGSNESGGIRTRPVTPINTGKQHTINIGIPSCTGSTLIDEQDKARDMYHLLFILSLRSLYRIWDECDSAWDQCHLSQVKSMDPWSDTPPPNRRVGNSNRGGDGPGNSTNFYHSNKVDIPLHITRSTYHSNYPYQVEKKCVGFLDPDKVGIHSKYTTNGIL